MKKGALILGIGAVALAGLVIAKKGVGLVACEDVGQTTDQNYPCKCPSGYVRQSTWVGWDAPSARNIYEFNCVPIDYVWIPIDPADPNLLVLIEEAAKYKLAELFPLCCPEMTCSPDPPKTLEVSYIGSPATHGMVECREDYGGWGYIWFSVVFSLADGSLHDTIDSFCWNPDRSKVWRCLGTQCWEETF